MPYGQPAQLANLIPHPIDNTGKKYKPSIKRMYKMLADMPGGSITLADGTKVTLSREILAAHKQLRDANDDNLTADERGRQLERFQNRYRGKPKEDIKMSGTVNLNVPIEKILARQDALLNGAAAEAEFEDMNDQVATVATENGENVINLLQNPEQQFPETANAEPIQI